MIYFPKRKVLEMRKISVQFLLITAAIWLLSWGSCVLCSLCGIAMTEVPLLRIPYLLGGFSPTIASYLVLKKHHRVEGFREWLKTVFDFRHSMQSYLLIPVLAGVFFFVLCRFSGYEPGAPLFAILFMVPIMLFGGGLEETGWRGVLFPELEKSCGCTAATALVALIWWLWHLPLFFISGVSQYGADFLSFGINVLGLSFALSAIKKSTSSTWLCVLFHCVVNSLHGVYLVADNRMGSGMAAAVLMVCSYCLMWLQNKKQIFS